MTLRRHLSRWHIASSVTALAAATLLVTSVSDHASATAAEPVEAFTATAANLSGVGRPGLGTVDIVIERWSTDGERDRLVSVLKDKGADALLIALQKMPRVGYIRTPNSIGWDLHFARSVKTEEGRQVVIATDRPMSFWEAANRDPSTAAC